MACPVVEMENRPGDCCWKGVVVACRCFGIITSLVLWGVGVEYVYYGIIFGIYFIVIAVITSFLEVVFLVNSVVEVCLSPTSAIMHVWSVILSFDDWKKGGLYFILFAPPCFVKPAEVVLGIPAGCLLIITGVFYMLKTFKTKRDEENAGCVRSTAYDRFDDTWEEDLEDNIVNPINGPTSAMTTVADQSEVLDL